MARTSQWADNPEMWEHVARLRKGGMKYSAIQGRLAVQDRARFGLEEVPSEDVIRYNLKKRSLLGKSVSPLPTDELEDHYGALTYIGNVLRNKIQSPTDRNARGPGWQGFEVGGTCWPDPKTEAEEEVSGEWEESDSGPEAFTQYIYFRKHMDGTLKGRKVNNALDAVKRTAAGYNEERAKLVRVVAAEINRALPGIDQKKKLELMGTVSRALVPRTRNPRLRRRPSSTPVRSAARKSELDKKIDMVLDHLKTTGANADLARKLKKLITAQSNLRAALVPPTLVRRMVQDAECELCSAKLLERAK